MEFRHLQPRWRYIYADQHFSRGNAIPRPSLASLARSDWHLKVPGVLWTGKYVANFQYQNIKRPGKVS